MKVHFHRSTSLSAFYLNSDSNDGVLFSLQSDCEHDGLLRVQLSSSSGNYDPTDMRHLEIQRRQILKKEMNKLRGKRHRVLLYLLKQFCSYIFIHNFTTV